jgi:hypothetical protein
MTDRREDEALAHELSKAIVGLALADEELPWPEEETIAARRRRRRAPPPSSLARVSLVRVDDVLRWTYQRPPRTVGTRRARRASLGLVGADVIQSFDFEEVPPNQVIAALEKIDGRLTRHAGLRRWVGGKLSQVDHPAKTKRALLFIHGTFSKGEVFFDELSSNPEGKAFLGKAQKEYEQLLSFDHPTLSVSPMLNALDLEHALRGYAGQIDVITHSRGGLVVSWWLRSTARPIGTVVFAASPLRGTSLASPARLKAALDGLANVANAIEKLAELGGTFVPPTQPMLGVAAALMKILGGTLSFGARTPLLDAGVAIVPGLAAQSLVSNNQELMRLWPHPCAQTPTCHAISANFEPGDPNESWWKFLARWRRPVQTAADVAADAVFPDANDLVVDTASMQSPNGSWLKFGAGLPFGRTPTVHHCNYFAQPETAKFLKKALAL